MTLYYSFLLTNYTLEKQRIVQHHFSVISWALVSFFFFLFHSFCLFCLFNQSQSLIDQIGPAGKSIERFPTPTYVVYVGTSLDVSDSIANRLLLSAQLAAWAARATGILRCKSGVTNGVRDLSEGREIPTKVLNS